MEDQIPQRMSYADWVIDSLGWPTIHLLFLMTVLVLALISWLHLRGRGPTVAPTLMLLIPLPCFIGCLISVRVMIELLLLIAISSNQPLLFYRGLMLRAILVTTVSACCSLALLIAGITLLSPHGVRRKEVMHKGSSE